MLHVIQNPISSIAMTRHDTVPLLLVHIVDTAVKNRLAP